MRTIQPAAPQAYLDTPQIIYSAWNKSCGGIDGQLGSIPVNTRIAIIGGGIAGVTAAFELAKASGFSNSIVLYEARAEIGGRTRSVATPDGTDVAELGAMRFPPSEDLLYYYANSLGFSFISGFPDPGVQPTIVSYQGQSQTWDSSETYPKGFGTVYEGWHAFLSNGVTSQGVPVLQSANWLQERLQNPSNYASVIPAWQAYLDTFGNDSFYTGLQRIFGPDHEWDVPGGVTWSEGDFNRFATLGLGSGGFGPLFRDGFNAVFRLMPNGLETDQSTFARGTTEDDARPAGIQELTQAIWARAADFRITTRTSTKAVVVDSVRNPDYSNIVTVREFRQDGSTNDEKYDVVIVATTTRAMNVGMSLSDFRATGHQANTQYLLDEVCEAVNDSHMLSSSKLFIRTSKFWEGKPNGFPRNILSDTKAPQLYTLDYGDPNAGMVLVTYTWEDQSTQLMAVSDSPVDSAPSADALLRVLNSELANVMRNTDYPNYTDNLAPLTPGDIYAIHWQLDANSYGAFTFAEPGQDAKIASMFYSWQQQILYTANNAGVFIVGDCTSFIGGWIDGALQSTMNVVSAILYLYGVLNPVGAVNAPISRLSSDTYRYALAESA